VDLAKKFGATPGSVTAATSPSSATGPPKFSGLPVSLIVSRAASHG
jgi:hypothetical protein